MSDVKENLNTEEEILIDINTDIEAFDDYADIIEPIEETAPEKDRSSYPIYIIGSNPLAYYLGANLQSAGEKVIVLLEHQHTKSSLNTDGISIKEDRNLTQKRYRLETSFLMKYPAKMVIVTSFANNINTALSSISTKQIDNAPVVFFTLLKDVNYLEGLLGKNIHKAYFRGYLYNNNQTISVYGRNTSILINPPHNTTKIDKSVISIFDKTNLETHFSDNQVESFWDYFAPYALCSIFSAAYNMKISELLKDKILKEKFKPLAEEFSSLAETDGIYIGDKSILKGVYNTPSNYVFPLHQAILTGTKTEFNLLSSVVNSAAHKKRLSIPETNALLKMLYSNILETA